MAWHDYIALALVAGAAGVVLRSLYKFVLGTKAGGCASGCSSCPSNQTSPPALLSIGDDPGSATRRSSAGRDRAGTGFPSARG